MIIGIGNFARSTGTDLNYNNTMSGDIGYKNVGLLVHGSNAASDEAYSIYSGGDDKAESELYSGYRGWTKIRVYVASGKTVFNCNVGIGTDNPSEKLELNGWIGRSAHNNGALCGSYNNVAYNDAKTNPIYVIGGSYKPNESDLNNMYGIGYTHQMPVLLLQEMEMVGDNILLLMEMHMLVWCFVWC